MSSQETLTIQVDDEACDVDGTGVEGCNGRVAGGRESVHGTSSPWYMIPRAALRRPHQERNGTSGHQVVDVDQASSASSSSSSVTAAHVREWLDSSPTHSNTSTQSGSSGSLLLTAANLAALRLEAGTGTAVNGIVVTNAGGIQTKPKDPDCTSLASSTHFTVVNYGRAKPTKRSICAKHTVSALVITTCSIFLLGLTAAVYYIDMRTKAIRYS